MKKRVLAWVLLTGFVLLILNIIVFHVFLKQSVAVYAVIAIWFVFTNKPLPSDKIIKTGGNIPEGTLNAESRITREAEEASEESKE